MAYGTILADTLQSSTANTPVVFKDGNGTQIGTLCRAWVNFNGTGTVAIKSSFNVSSITDNGTGDYTVNFTTAMPNANYAFVLSRQSDSGQGGYGFIVTGSESTAPTTSALRIWVQSALTFYDTPTVCVAIFD